MDLVERRRNGPLRRHATRVADGPEWAFLLDCQHPALEEAADFRSPVFVVVVAEVDEMIGSVSCGTDSVFEPGWQLPEQLDMPEPTERRNGEVGREKIVGLAVEDCPEVRADPERIEKVDGGIGQPQTSLTVDRVLGVGLGIVQTPCGLPNQTQIAAVRRSADGKSVVAGVAGIVGVEEGNVGRPPRIGLMVFSDPAAEIVVEETEGVVAVLDSGLDRIECLLVDHDSTPRTVYGLRAVPSLPGRIQDRQRWTQSGRTGGETEGRLKQTAAFPERRTVVKLSSRQSLCD